MSMIGMYLNAKYNILGRQADAATTQANAAALAAGGRSALDYANAGQAPGLAASENSLRGHQGSLMDAQGRYYGSEAAKSNFLAPHQANLMDRQGGEYGARTRQINQGIEPLDNATPGIDPITGAPDAGYAKGTANVPASPAEIDFLHQHLKATHGLNKVPGKGPSTVDTVPAMLAPREAVLNEHAADLIGRDKIAAANAIGVAHQKAQTGGMVTPKAEPKAKPTHQKLSGGTHMVGHGKSAKTPSKIDPQALLSLMGAMQGGQAPGGAPMQGPAGPMPGRGMV